MGKKETIEKIVITPAWHQIITKTILEADTKALYIGHFRVKRINTSFLLYDFVRTEELSLNS